MVKTGQNYAATGGIKAGNQKEGQFYLPAQPQAGHALPNFRWRIIFGKFKKKESKNAFNR
ncbi:MAG: hypothetical protein MUC97_03845 [Bernardetiaceae bacterium]|jgi:hypothetical protein|nr:hypothetical protein [Bernardetiaceae bacterium]